MNSIEITFNKRIIDKIKSYNFQVDQLGSILFILLALYEGKIDLLDEFDDSNKERRALMLYEELVLRDLLKSSLSEDKTIYVLTEPGIELIKFIKNNSNEVTAEKVAISGVDQLKTEIVSGSIESWIDEWLNIFPRGVKTGGKLVRSDKQGCIKRMEIFMKDYKYDKETILAATRAYEESKRVEGYQYMRCAVYFIYRVETTLRDKLSDLAAWCEQITHEKENPSPEDTFEILA